MSFLGDLFDPVGAAVTGGNNNTFDAVLNPAQDTFGQNGLDWSPSFMNSFDNNVAQPISNFGDDVVNTNLDELKNLGNHFGKNPGQLFYSGADPLSTHAWNAALGTHNTPFLNQYGGETNQDYANSQSRGVNTTGGQYVGALANSIAGMYAGQWAGGVAGNAWGSAFPSSTAGSTVAVPEGSMGSSALNMQAELSNPALAGSGGSEAGWAAGGAPGVTSAGASSFGTMGSNFNGPVSGAARGAVSNTANALDNNQNPWKAGINGAGAGAASSGIDYAGSAGVEDPQYKGVLNNTLNGAVGAKVNGGNMDNGAVMGMLSGLGNAYGTPAMNWLSSQFGGNTSPGTNGASSTGNSGGINNFGNLVAGLGSLYLSQKAKNANNSQISNLNSLYSPNSPYAQQMQQALDRQDAAAGRRSQYGTRQVELQARLAQLNSQNAPMLNQLEQQKRNIDFGQLGSLYQMGKNTGAFQAGMNGLQNMFQPQANYNAPANGAYDMGGQTYNNPSAYTAPQVPSGGNPNWYSNNDSNAYYGG